MSTRATLTTCFCIGASITACRIGYDTTQTDATVDVSATNDSTSSTSNDTATDAAYDTTSPCTTGSCRRIFVTSSILPSGAIGGLSAADALCQSTAQHLGGTWMALLAGTTTSLATRLAQATVPYVLLDGTMVAADWTALMSGTLAHAIDMYETGASRTSGDAVGVWTGANTNGTPTTSSCNDWTVGTGMAQGGAGDDSATGSAWSTSGPNPCSLGRRLYCVEQ